MKQNAIKSIRDRVNDIIKVAEIKAKEDISRAAMGGIFETYYLYYRPSTATTEGELRLFAESAVIGDEWKLATGEGLRGNIPYTQYNGWIQQRSSQLPILAWNY